MKITRRLRRSGMTLIELTIGIGVGMTIAVMLLALANQQLAFLRIFSAQSFLTDEAPMVGMYVGKMAGKADRFRLHASLADALTGNSPRLTASPVMVMNFRQPDGTVRASILSFERQGERDVLNYYLVPATGSIATPQWSITRKAADVSFSVEQGILRMTLTGPANERITYSGTMQQ